LRVELDSAGSGCD